MKALLGKLKSALVFVGKLFTSKEGQIALDLIAELAPQAAPIVRLIESMTPKRDDAEITRLLDQFNLLPWVDAYLKLPIADRGPALQHVAASVLGNIAPSGTSRAILNAAVDLAVVNMKTGTP